MHRSIEQVVDSWLFGELQHVVQEALDVRPLPRRWQMIRRSAPCTLVGDLRFLAVPRQLVGVWSLEG